MDRVIVLGSMARREGRMSLTPSIEISLPRVVHMTPHDHPISLNYGVLMP